MRRRDVLPEPHRSPGEPQGHEVPARIRRAGRSRRLVAVMIGVVTVTGAACGEDGNDAPGGSAPPASPAATGNPAGPGPGSPDTGPSPEAADEAHPSVPAAAVDTTDGG